MNSASANASGSWPEQLTGAFEILLDRPLASFDADAVYATFFGGELINELGFTRDAAWLAPAALSGAEPVVWACPIFDLEEPLPEFDASRSVFEFDKAGLPPEFETDLAAASFTGRLVLGADLAPLLARHDLTATDLGATWTVCYPRLPSDGTLFDAMRVATALGTGPETLLPFEVDAAEEWREKLAAVTSPELFAHLSFFCTEGEEGLMYLGTERTGGDLLAAEGCTLIANWEEGQSQVEFAVVQLGELMTGPHRT
ncbi:hypothetical protein [Actinomadura roseirufa]|uniref:hypothetical protein n=1 Tax=Actinomadura roseirufa TaxID=2094049 RepID=UPI0010416C9F|nr:hypothetical protein [Actinomadura roseirufa]